jgi:hypothetical protein
MQHIITSKGPRKRQALDKQTHDAQAAYNSSATRRQAKVLTNRQVMAWAEH